MNVNRGYGSAVDANGLHQSQRDYPSGHAPWLDDRVAVVAPKYPVEDRRLHHEGVCWVGLTLDLKTGRVNNVVVTKSSGFKSLDQSAINAFRKWQWKPEKWKQVEITTNFTMHNPPLAPGAVQLPRE